MTEHEEYTLRIDAYSPETMPMARLAEYMTTLANLLGQPERVHFVGVKPGSTCIVHKIEREAAPKVRERLGAVAANDAPDDARKAFKELNKMLRSDNAVADLNRSDGSAKILRFPGREEVVPDEIGPFSQPTELDGTLVRIGGKDATAHAMILTNDGATPTCEVSREMARSLAQYLFGQPIRVRGIGRWFRDSEGQWQLKQLRADAFELLNDRGLSDTVVSLRAIGGNKWKEMDDPLADLRAQREDDQGVH